MLPVFNVPSRSLFDVFREWDGEWEKAFVARDPSTEALRTPRFEVEEQDGDYRLEVELPGIPKENIEVNLKDGGLYLRAEFKKDGTGETTRRHYEAAFRLPEGVDENKVEASYENGILSLAIPKAEAAKPKRIPIGEGKETFLGRVVKGLKADSTPSNEAKAAIGG